MNPLLSLTPVELPVLESQARKSEPSPLGAPACERLLCSGNCTGLGSRGRGSSPASAPFLAVWSWEDPICATTHSGAQWDQDSHMVSRVVWSPLTSASPPWRLLSDRQPASHLALQPSSLQPLTAQLLSSQCLLSSCRQMWPQTTADRQRRTAAPSRQLPPHMALGTHRDTQQPHGDGDPPREPQRPWSRAGSLSQGPSWWGTWLRPSPPFTMHTGDLANTYAHSVTGI